MQRYLRRLLQPGVPVRKKLVTAAASFSPESYKFTKAGLASNTKIVADFLNANRRQCLDNPARCCKHNRDCRSGYLCTLGSCKAPSFDKQTLLATFVRDPHDGAAWRALTGWNNMSDPCQGFGWTGKKTPFMRHFYAKNDHFTMTGLGQT
jgi:hypothetical protein